jgi:hypothetical protein
VALAVCAFASVTVTVNVEVAAVVGVPVRAPLVARLRPAGSEPEVSVKLYGVVPFTAATVALYTVPTTPLGSVAVVMETGSAAAPTVTLKLAVAVPDFASVTLTVKL